MNQVTDTIDQIIDCVECFKHLKAHILSKNDDFTVINENMRVLENLQHCSLRLKVLLLEAKKIQLENELKQHGQILQRGPE